MIHVKKMHDPDLEETRLDSKPAFAGRMLKVFVDTAKLPNGRTSTRELVRHPGAAAVVAVLPDGRVLLERQYRYALGTVMYEVPAGKLDPGEEPEHCARRELSEETGYEADHWARSLCSCEKEASFGAAWAHGRRSRKEAGCSGFRLPFGAA